MEEFLEVVNLFSVLGSLVFGTVVGSVYGWRIQNQGDLFWLGLIVASWLIGRTVYNYIAADIPVGRGTGALALWLVVIGGMALGHRIRRYIVKRHAEREVRHGRQSNRLSP